MISFKQVESIVTDDILYIAILIGLCVVSFGLGLSFGFVWTLLL